MQQKNRTRKRENPFSQISNELLNDPRISFKAKGLYAYMYSKPDGWNFTIKSIAKQNKDGVDAVASALKELKEFGWVEYEKFSDGTGSYYLLDELPKLENPNLENPNMGKSSPIINKDISSNKDLYINNSVAGQVKEIVEYLNVRAGKSFKAKSQSTVRAIRARLNEGFAIEDFKRVIDNKVAEWKGTQMEQYLRPITLFGNKFESYLNMRPIASTDSDYFKQREEELLREAEQLAREQDEIVDVEEIENGRID